MNKIASKSLFGALIFGVALLTPFSVLAEITKQDQQAYVYGLRESSYPAVILSHDEFSKKFSTLKDDPDTSQIYYYLKAVSLRGKTQKKILNGGIYNHVQMTPAKQEKMARLLEQQARKLDPALAQEILGVIRSGVLEVPKKGNLILASLVRGLGVHTQLFHENSKSDAAIAAYDFGRSLDAQTIHALAPALQGLRYSQKDSVAIFALWDGISDRMKELQTGSVEKRQISLRRDSGRELTSSWSSAASAGSGSAAIGQ
jgi:hypothetical protein